MTFTSYRCNRCTKRVIKGDMAVGWGLPNFLSHDTTNHLKPNSLNFEIFYEDNNPPIPCNETAPVTLRMSNVSEKINNKEEWYSIPFFAFDGGYQMCLKVYPNSCDIGEDISANLSVSIHLMKGPNDDKLQQSGRWPIEGIFTIKLLNQFSDHNHSIKFSKNDCDECVKRVINGDMAAEWGEVYLILPLKDTNSYVY